MILTLLAVLAALAPAPAPSARPVCVSATPVAAPYAAWPGARPLEDAVRGIEPGSAVDIPVIRLDQIRMPFLRRDRPLAGPYLATHGFDIRAAGRYAVAVGGARSALRPLWLDIVGRDGKPLTSVGHGHGPTCSGITKIVEFDLTPGRYTLIASELPSADQRVRVLLVRKP